MPARHFLTAVALWALALISPLAGGCDGQDVNPAVETFQREISGFCQKYGAKLHQVIEKPDRSDAEQILDGIFREAREAGQPLPFSLFILNKDEDLLAAHLSSRDSVEKSSLQAYREGRFRLPGGIKKVLSKGRTRPIRLYLQGGDELWMIVVPLKTGSRVAGAALLSFHGDWVSSKRGLDAEDFLALKIDQ